MTSREPARERKRPSENFRFLIAQPIIFVHSHCFRKRNDTNLYEKKQQQQQCATPFMTTVLRRVHKKSQNITITIRLIASIIRIDYSGFCEYMNKGEPGRVSMEFRLELNANGWYKKGV